MSKFDEKKEIDELFNKIEVLENKIGFSNFSDSKIASHYKKIDLLIECKADYDDCQYIQKIDRVIDALDHEIDEKQILELNFTPVELGIIKLGLIYLKASYDAQDYIATDGGWGKGVPSQERLRTVSEIMLIMDNNNNKKLNLHGSEEFHHYWAFLRDGSTPREASEKIFKQFKFSSQEACDKWLQREIKKRKAENNDLYGDIKGPGTHPR